MMLYCKRYRKSLGDARSNERKEKSSSVVKLEHISTARRKMNHEVVIVQGEDEQCGLMDLMKNVKITPKFRSSSADNIRREKSGDKESRHTAKLPRIN